MVAMHHNNSPLQKCVLSLKLPPPVYCAVLLVYPIKYSHEITSYIPLFHGFFMAAHAQC